MAAALRLYKANPRYGISALYPCPRVFGVFYTNIIIKAETFKKVLNAAWSMLLFKPMGIW